MDFIDLIKNPLDAKTTGDMLWAGVDITGSLVQQLHVFITFAFVVLYMTRLGEALTDENSRWTQKHLWLLFFLSVATAVWGCLGTAFNVTTGQPEDRNFSDMLKPLESSQGILNIRDMIAMAAGFVGGIGFGLITGTVAALVRLALGGVNELALASAFAALLLGLLGGLLHNKSTPSQYLPLMAMLAGLLATVIQRIILLLALTPLFGKDYAWRLTFIVLFPKLFANVFGIGLITLILGMVKKRQQEAKKELSYRRIQILALRAQVEPHFLRGTLNHIRAIIRPYPEQARSQLKNLAEYFQKTHPLVKRELITLREELDHTLKYLSFWQSRHKDMFNYPQDLLDTLEPSLLAFGVPPFSVHVLAENARTHGFASNKPFKLDITVRDGGDFFDIILADNGRGIPKDKLEDIGRRSVESTTGTGTALCNLQEMLHLTLGQGARLNIASIVGKGTIVTLTLPKRKML